VVNRGGTLRPRQVAELHAVGEVLLGPFAVNRVVADKGAQLVEAGYAGLMARFVEPDAAPEQLVDGLDGAGL